LEVPEFSVLRILLAQHVFGLEMRVVKPTWYKLPVALFYVPGHYDWIQYSWDADSCNAMMCANGKDGRSAPSLPFWAEEMEHAWSVVEQMHERGLHLELIGSEGGFTVRFGADTASFAAGAPEAIARAALRAVGVELQDGPLRIEVSNGR